MVVVGLVSRTPPKLFSFQSRNDKTDLDYRTATPTEAF